MKEYTADVAAFVADFMDLVREYNRRAGLPEDYGIDDARSAATATAIRLQARRRLSDQVPSPHKPYGLSNQIRLLLPGDDAAGRDNLC